MLSIFHANGKPETVKRVFSQPASEKSSRLYVLSRRVTFTPWYMHCSQLYASSIRLGEKQLLLSFIHPLFRCRAWPEITMFELNWTQSYTLCSQMKWIFYWCSAKNDACLEVGIVEMLHVLLIRLVFNLITKYGFPNLEKDYRCFEFTKFSTQFTFKKAAFLKMHCN